MHYLPLTEAPLLKRNHYYGKAIVMQFQSHEGYLYEDMLLFSII